MARALATAMADGGATEMVAAMVCGKHSSGPRQWQQWWAIATAIATAMAMAMTTATELETEMAMVMAMEMAMARATTTKEGLPLHVAATCSAFGRSTPCLHPHGHKESAITSAAS